MPRRLIAIAAVLLCAHACAAVRRGAPPPEIRLPPGELLRDDLTPEPDFERAAVIRAVVAKGIRLTEDSEGWQPRLYEDVAHYCTIGYGHLVKKQRCDGTEPPEFLTGITEPRGEALLIGDMQSAQRTVSSAVTAMLTDGQFAALVDFVFNVGSPNFKSSTLIGCVNRREWRCVPPQLRRWILAGGTPWPGLQQRREREIDLFFDGIPVPESTPTKALPAIDIRVGESLRDR